MSDVSISVGAETRFHRQFYPRICLDGFFGQHRVNLTLRELIPPLSRRTWSFAQNEQSLKWHIEWGRAYYHFCRYHESLRLPTTGPLRYRSKTPTMAAGLARRRWRVSDLLLMTLPPA